MRNNRTPEQDAFFDQFYHSQFQKMWKYAVVMLRKHDLAEEVIQNAFLEALLHIEFLMSCQRPELWLQRTVEFKALHKLRDQSRDIKRLVSLSDETITLQAPDEFSSVEEDELESLNNTKQRIRDALTQEEQRLLKRVALDGTSYKQVSSETGLSVGACQKRIQRIRNKLKRKFPNH